MITIADFKKLDLRVGKIISVERVENSEKLLKLEIDLSDEKRQLVAGIGREYTPEDLVDKQVVIIANLEPRTLMGLESNGMILCADVDGAPVLLQPEKSVPPGTKIR